MKDKYNLSLEENIFLVKRNLVDYIWKSANLEGIGVTFPETQAICDGLSVANFHIEEVNAINDLKHAWMLLLDSIAKPIDFELIKQVHIQLGKFSVVNVGFIRTTDVRILGTDWMPDIPDKDTVIADVQNLLEGNFTSTEKAIEVMLYLMRAQVFYDGNKRLAMLIANKVMIENGAGIISVPQRYIKDFYTLLISYYETGDSTDIKKFIYDNCIDGIVFK